MLLFVGTRLCLWLTQKLVPANGCHSVRPTNQRKSVTTCFFMLYFFIFSPFCEGVGKGLSKEQRKRKRVIGDERKRKGAFGLGKSHSGAGFMKAGDTQCRLPTRPALNSDLKGTGQCQRHRS